MHSITMSHLISLVTTALGTDISVISFRIHPGPAIRAGVGGLTLTMVAGIRRRRNVRAYA